MEIFLRKKLQDKRLQCRRENFLNENSNTKTISTLCIKSKIQINKSNACMFLQIFQGIRNDSNVLQQRRTIFKLFKNTAQFA